MTYDEIQKAVYRLKEMMTDAEFENVSCHFEVKSYSRPRVALFGPEGFFGKCGVEYFADDDPAKAFAAAEKFIRALPAPDKRSLAKFQRKLAEALDIAKDENIADDVSDGARQSMTAVSELLLGHDK